MNRCTVCGSFEIAQTLKPVQTTRRGTAFRASVTCHECGAHATAIKAAPDEALDAAVDAMAIFARRSTIAETAVAFGRSIVDAAFDAYKSDVEAWQ